MFRIFGFAAVFVFAVSAEVFGVVLTVEAAPDGLLVVGTAVPVKAVEPAPFEPFAGDEVVGGAGGSVVNGVGGGGKGLVITLAIKSVSPTSD